jgi:OmpA-OmpF porin, OOP family
MTMQSRNDQARAKEAEALRAQLSTSLRDAAADQPESDPLAALDTAARTVHARGKTGTVVLVDSGVQTSGALRYQSGDLLLASGTDVVAHLRSAGQLPDLSGMTVLLVGLGDTAAPQARLDTATRNRLVEQWSAISSAAGADCVEVDTQPLTGVPPSSSPRVSRVRVSKPAQPKLPEDPHGPVALREDSVGFVDNSDELRDPRGARASLKPLARDIVEGRYEVSLVGTTATAGSEAGRQALSLKRAEAVKGLLVDLGVPSRWITTRGVGIHHPAHVDDLDAQGNLIPAAAIRNRAVFVTARSS